MKKNIKKKYLYTVNVSDIETLSDIPVVFALAKQNANLPITDEELMDIVSYALDYSATIKMCECFNKALDTINSCALLTPQRKPWYKRAFNTITSPVSKTWNWIKNKFKK